MTGKADPITPVVAAINAGAKAAWQHLNPAACPHPAGSDLHAYWLQGFGVRQAAMDRWASYPDRVAAMVKLHRPRLDSRWDGCGVRPSQRMLLGFYAVGSEDPDAAFEALSERLEPSS